MFTPVVPLPGIAGWRFLEATEGAQRTAFERGPVLEREITHFEEKIGSITSAAELVADRTLLKVALGAFGLDEDLFKRAFLEQILAEGSEDPQALANRFVDPRYREFAAAFGFGDVLGARTQDAGFGRVITNRFRERQFDIAVGGVNDTMRLALNFRREAAGFGANGQSEAAQWYEILGSPPLRQVIEVALNLPAEFSQIDIDKQVETLQTRTSAVFGDSAPSVFADPAVRNRAIDRFLAVSQIDAGPSGAIGGSAATALTLLQSSGLGASATRNLLLSNTS